MGIAAAVGQGGQLAKHRGAIDEVKGDMIDVDAEVGPSKKCTIVQLSRGFLSYACREKRE